MIERDQWLENNRTLVEEQTMSLKKQDIQEKFKGYFFNKDEAKYMLTLTLIRPYEDVASRLHV